MSTVVITGSTRGIGRGLASEFVQRGHKAGSAPYQSAVRDLLHAAAPSHVDSFSPGQETCD